jgi:hypothetical protein
MGGKAKSMETVATVRAKSHIF